MAEREVLNDIGLIFRFFKCKINELGYCTRLTLLCGEKHGMCLPQAYDQPARLLGQCWPTFKKTLAVLALQRMTHGRLISMYEPLDEPENSWMAVCHATKQMNDNPKYVSSIPSSKWNPIHGPRHRSKTNAVTIFTCCVSNLLPVSMFVPFAGSAPSQGPCSAE